LQFYQSFVNKQNVQTNKMYIYCFFENFYLVFSFTSAVTTALQYTVSNRIFEDDKTEQGYVYHVIITSLGTIVGPIIGGNKCLLNEKMNISSIIYYFAIGFFLDMTGSYKAIIPTSIFFLFVSFISFGSTILLLNKKKPDEIEPNQTAAIHQHDNAAYGSSY